MVFVVFNILDSRFLDVRDWDLWNIALLLACNNKRLIWIKSQNPKANM